MSNIYHESEHVIDDLRSGRIPHLSIIKVQWPSGNSQTIRFHHWNKERDKLVGCGMQWDNLALEDYDVSRGIVSILELPTNITSE